MKPVLGDAPAERLAPTPGRERDRDLRFVLGLEGHRDARSRRTKHDELTELVLALGHDGVKYRREATKRLRAVVSEVFSAPRVTAAARRHPRIGIIPGVALDLTVNDETGQPWNFSVSAF